MILKELPIILYWWSLLFGLGVVFLPLTRRLFPKFFDQGYGLSKILGLLLVSYSVWLLASLKILPFFSETIWLIIIGFVGWNYIKIKNLKARQAGFLRNIKIKNLKIILLEELLFLICLVAWSWVRGFQPAISGLEKYMDYGFVNSLLRSRFFPPLDMWFSGETINYYYFGHLAAAVLTKLSGLDSAITYNLMIASLFAFTFTAGFSFAANLVKSLGIRNLKLVIAGGLISALLLSLGGNLHLLWYFLTNKGFTGYWYPDATRFIVEKFGASDNTIHEFPVYSFIVADLHGHLSNLPFVLLFLALLFSFISGSQKKKDCSLFVVHCSLLFAVFYMTNAWDVPIYGLILGTALLLNFKSLWRTIKFGAGILALGILFSLPFHLHFKSLAEGVALVDFHSPLWMILVLWGWPLFLTLTFLAGFRLIKRNKLLKKTDVLVAVLLAVSWLLIVLPELIYVKDIYIHSYQRANTMFKLTYQAFVMFSLVSGYILSRNLAGIKNRTIKGLLAMSYSLLTISLLAYAYFGVKSYYGLKNYQTLNGLEYLRHSYPDDYQAILWLKKNIKDQPVILEAVGESYTDYARVSANTGLPTILGWPVHEWLWRGGYDQPGKRREEIRQIYEAATAQTAKGLLSQYEVEYVFLGRLEKEQYKNLNEANFSQLGKIIYQIGETKIYQIRD